MAKAESVALAAMYDVVFDQSIEGIEPESVNEIRLASGAVMSVAAFGTFHSDWAHSDHVIGHRINITKQ